MQSPNNTVTGLRIPSITDANGTIWSIVDGQVAVNGISDPTTANVTELAYESGLIWQKNADNLWWSKSAPGDQWAPPYGTLADPIPGQQVSANDSTVTPRPFTSDVIIDASGNDWSILNGQVLLNGIADPTTSRVIEIAYVNGNIWQENADRLWWSKVTPSDQWSPAFGTSLSPVPAISRTWLGGRGFFSTGGDWTPNGAPQAGDTAVINAAQMVVNPGDATGVNFLFQDIAAQGNPAATPQVNFDGPGAFNIGTVRAVSGAFISLGLPGAGPGAVLTTTGVHLSGSFLEVGEFVNSHSTLIVLGNSSLRHGSSLDVHLVGTGGLPAGSVENDGTMRINASTLIAGALTGQGVIRAVNNSTLNIATASAGETIQLQSAHLEIPGTFTPLGFGSNGLNFLAPITDFGPISSISLDGTQATSEMFAKASPTAGELFLYNGSQMVADLHISGQANIYAEQQFPSVVLLTPYDTGHSLPIQAVPA